MSNKPLFVFLALAALPRLAHADVSAQDQRRMEANDAFRPYGKEIRRMKEDGLGARLGDASETACYDLLKKYKDLPDDAQIAGEFKGLPSAYFPDWGRNDENWVVPFAKAREICDAHSALVKKLNTVRPVAEYHDKNSLRPPEPVADYEWRTIAKSPLKIDATGLQAYLDGCNAAADAAIAAGNDADDPIRYGTQEITIAQVRTGCANTVTWETEFVEKTNAWAKAKWDEVESKYTKVGMKGDRLALFMEYDGSEWYLPGCDQTTSDPKKLKKAKKLFGWYRQDDGRIIVEKYVFKGNKYVVSQREFYLPEEAYRWCK